MLPETFLTWNIPDYKCSRCENALDSHSVLDIIDRIDKDLSSLTKNDLAVCWAFIEKYANVIHENHFLMTDVKWAIAQRIHTYLEHYSDELVMKIITMCKNLNTLFTTLNPGRTSIFVFFFFLLFCHLRCFARDSLREFLRLVELNPKP
jgi:hypothetical protein